MTRSKVGRDGPRCGAKLRQGHGTCAQVAGWGTPHVGYGACRLHGGNTASQVTGAERRQVEDGARRILADLGAAAPIENPLFALQQLAGEVLAFRDALRSMVEKLTGVRYSGEAGEGIRGEVVLYERALDRCTRILVDIARLNLDERLARISERQADIVVEVLQAGLKAAGIGPGSQQDQEARRAVAAALRRLSAAPAAEHQTPPAPKRKVNP